MISKYTDLFRTADKLGWSNVLYVFRYRLELKIGVRKLWFKPFVFKVEDDFYSSSAFSPESLLPLPEKEFIGLKNEADDILQGRFRYYSYHKKYLGNPPDWFLNPFNGKHAPGPEKHWTKIKAFGAVGDIKNVWEASRFDWVYTLCRAYAYTQNQKYLTGLNHLLNDWHLKNPLNQGTNWYCGQEASIRLFALLNCSLLFDYKKNLSNSLLESIYAHLKRIYPNISYALAQDNNHGTSETAVLYVGGNWLAVHGKEKAERNFGKKVARIGKRKLELVVSKLIDNDGTFSQYSVNYHRVALDTLCFVEIWRRKFNLEPFSNSFYAKVRAATKWLRKFTDPITGKGLNIGSNDGAMLLRVHSCDYRDYRPSCQLSSLLFEKKLIFDQKGLWNEPIHFFDNNKTFAVKKRTIIKKNESIDNNYLMFAAGEAWACMRLPKYKFRPKQMDVFHFDFSYKGVNVLCDAGSYSYNSTDLNFKRPFKSVRAHNTVYFGNEQMPQLSHFLTGSWLQIDELSEAEILENGKYRRYAAYYDYRGNYHKRTVTCSKERWIIRDEIRPVSKDFIPELNFNLNVTGISIDHSRKKIRIPELKLELLFSEPVSIEKSEISEYYMEKHEVYAIKARFSEDLLIQTEILIN